RKRKRKKKKKKKKQMAKRRRRNERRANTMKVEGVVDDGRRGEQGRVAKAEDKKRKRERTKAKKMTHRSWHWTLDVCLVRRTCRSCGQALSRARRVPGSRRTSWPSFNRGYRIREKRERLNVIVDDSLRTLYRLERIC
ncbi:hypothetical protein ALC57_14036, partial [Trachymyrmex cornetzi]